MKHSKQLALAIGVNGRKVCLLCGSTRDLHVHHVNWDHRDNRAGNVVLLCEYCHTELHRCDRNTELKTVAGLRALALKYVIAWERAGKRSRSSFGLWQGERDVSLPMFVIEFRAQLSFRKHREDFERERVRREQERLDRERESAFQRERVAKLIASGMVKR